MPVVFKKVQKQEPVEAAKLTVKKKKSKLLDKKAVVLDQISERVDALYTSMMEAKTMRSQLAALDAKMKEPKEEFIALVNQVIKPADTMIAEGTEHKLKVAAAGKSRTITDIGQVSEYLEESQEGLFAELCKVTLADLDKYLTPKQLVNVVETTRDEKSRSLTPVKED